METESFWRHALTIVTTGKQSRNVIGSFCYKGCLSEKDEENERCRNEIIGVGKTTIVKNVHQLLKKNDIECVGFYTEEIRENRSRIGFDVVTTENVRGRLARDLNTLCDPLPINKVGKYGVLIKEFEDVALPLLEKVTSSGRQLLLIDEIGKMEMFSAPFKNKIKQFFHPTSKHIILATIPCKKSDNVVESIRTNPSTKLIEVKTTNRNELPNIIAKEILLKIK